MKFITENMNSRKIYLVLVCLFLFSTQINWTSASFFDWIRPNRNYFNEYQTTLPAVPFEISETNDRFIADTSKVLGIPLSEVDFCQQRVILSLKSSCKTLTGDELGKITIALLNCQNLAESRPTIECTDNMKLGQCIGQMTSENLLIYNQILSRTKAVCLTIRQEQFRGMAELTVNRLVDSAHQHLNMVERIKNNHAQLEKATLNSIEEVADNQIQLMEKQQELLKIADTQRITIESNLREMQREKNYIRSGQIELTTFMTNLKLKFNEGLTEIHDKNTKAKEIFEELFNDIAKLNDVSDKIAIRLETVSQLVFDKNRETSQQFQNTLVKLKDANEIVHNFSTILQTMKTDFIQQFEWVEKYLADRDTFLPQLSIIIVHVTYFVIGMIFLVFINANGITRFIFSISTVINFIAAIKQQIKLNMILLTETICIFLIVNYLMKFLNNYISIKGYKLQFKNNNDILNISKNNIDDDEIDQSKSLIDQIKRELNNNDNTNINHNNIDDNNHDNNLYTNNSNNDVQLTNDIEIRTTPVPTRSFIRAPSINIRREREEMSSERSSRSTTPHLEIGKCKAFTRSGAQCQFMTPSINADYCRIHERLSHER